MQEFDGWIQKGMQEGKQKAGNHWKTRFHEMPLYSFLYQSGNVNGGLSGVIVPSSDSVGRVYPFYIGVVLQEKRQLQEYLELSPLLFDSIYRKLYLWLSDIDSNPGEPSLQWIYDLIEMINRNLTEEFLRNQYLEFNNQNALDALPKLVDRNQQNSPKESVSACLSGLKYIWNNQRGEDNSLIQVVIPNSEENYYGNVSLTIALLNRLLNASHKPFSCFWTRDENSKKVKVYYLKGHATEVHFTYLVNEENIIQIDFSDLSPMENNVNRELPDFSSMKLSTFLDQFSHSFIIT